MHFTTASLSVSLLTDIAVAMFPKDVGLLILGPGVDMLTLLARLAGSEGHGLMLGQSSGLDVSVTWAPPSTDMSRRISEAFSMLLSVVSKMMEMTARSRFGNIPLSKLTCASRSVMISHLF